MIHQIVGGVWGICASVWRAIVLPLGGIAGKFFADPSHARCNSWCFVCNSRSHIRLHRQASWFTIVWSAGMVRHFEIMFHRFSQISTRFPHFWWAVYLAIQVYAFLLPVGKKKSQRDNSQSQKCRPRGPSDEIFRTFIPSQLFDIWCKKFRCFCGPSLAADSSQEGWGHLS